MTRLDWPRRWGGQWIWVEQPPWSVWEAPLAVPAELHNRVVLLRREFHVEGVPGQARARVTADSRFVLRVNGVEAARGPARSLPQRLAFTTVDVAPLLRRGANVIGALVRFYGRANAWYRPAQPIAHLGAGSFLFEAPALGVVSDAAWLALDAPYARVVPAPQNMPLELLDGAAMPWGWDLPGFDTSSWRCAVILGGGAGMTSPPADPYTAIEPAGIPPMTAIPVPMLARGERAITCATGRDPLALWPPRQEPDGADRVVLFDAGGETLATPWVQVRGAAGSIVDVYAGEDVDGTGLPVIEPRRWAMRLRPGGAGEERLESIEAVGFRHLAVVLRGDVRLLGAGAVERRQLRDPRIRFDCDDDALTAVWDACARTVELCATDALIDCPGREQRSWLGDLAVSGPVALACGLDASVLQRSLRIAAHSQRGDGLLAMASVGDVSLQPITIAEFSLHWLRAIRVLFAATQDEAAVRELLPAADEVIASLRRHLDTDGLLHDLPGWTWVDWAQTERGEVNGAVNALWIAALEDHALLLDLVRTDTAGAAAARTLAAAARHGFEQLWDDDRGVYVDTLGGGRRGARTSQQTNAAAIAWVGVDAQRAARILDRVLDPARLVITPTPADVPEAQQLIIQSLNPADFVEFDAQENVVAAQPFFMHVVHEALARHGRHEAIVASCRRWAAFLDGRHDTIGEYWSSPPPQASRCHAFSCTPAHDLVAHIVGLRPAVPRRTGAVAVDALGPAPFEVTFTPHLAGLGRACAQLPTPHGPVMADVDVAGAVLTVPDGVVVVVGEGGSPALPPQLLRAGTHRVSTGGGGRARAYHSPMTDEPTEPHHHTIKERVDAAHAAAEEVVADESGQLGGALNALAVPFEEVVAAVRAAINPDGLADDRVAPGEPGDAPETDATKEQPGH